MKPVFEVPKPPARPFQTGKEASFSDSVGRQLQASLMLPSIQSPSIPTSSDIGPQGLSFQTIAIGPNQKYPVQVKGNYLYVEGITWQTDDPSRATGIWGNVTVRPDTIQTTIPLTETYREIRWPTPFNFLELFNQDQSLTVYVTIYLGFGAVGRDRGLTRIWTNSQFSYFGAPVVVSKNHTLATLQFLQATSRYVQTAKIVSATVTKTFSTSTGVPNCSLWLFSTRPPTLTYNAPYNYSPALSFAVANVMGKIDFTTSVTGDVVSNNSSSFATGLQIPIYSDAFQISNNLPTFCVYGYLVTNDNYSSAGFEQWDCTLTVEYV